MARLTSARRALDDLDDENAVESRRDVDVRDDDEPIDVDELNDDTDEDQPPPERGLRRRIGLIPAMLAGLLVLAIGFGVGIYVGVPGHPGNDSPEAGFARDMITHHGQAVSMSPFEYRNTTDPELRQIAIDITLTQQAQIGMMSTWLDTWGLTPTSTAAPMSWMPDGGKALLVDGRMPGMATDAQLTQLYGSTGKARDLLFVQLMINHHLGGIHMTEAVIPLAHDAQVRRLAEQIKASQQSEVLGLQQIQKRLQAEK